MSDNYLGNPNLKKTNVQQEFTAEQMAAKADLFIEAAKEIRFY